MPTLKVTDTQVVSYEEYGAGPGLMLVHGSPGSASAWQPVGQRLSARFRIVAPNLPGYGGTSLEEPGGPDGVPHAAGLLESLIRETGVPDVLAGHSYGGAVALTVALRGQVKPRALALFEPVCTPILLATGETEPFASTLAAIARKGSLVKVDGATHALTATHSGEVAQLIAALADEAQPEKV